MKAIGIEKAVTRLRAASRHLDRLSALSKGLEVPAFEYGWFLPLSAINSAHEILSTTARKHSRSRQWFNSIDKHYIRKVSLLRFILHARGADHHGMTAGTTPKVEGAEYLGYAETSPITLFYEEEDGTKGKTSGPVVILGGDFTSFSFTYQLTSVTDDRDGTVYDPPATHLDQPLASTDPVSVARIAVAYYEGMAREAAKFIGP